MADTTASPAALGCYALVVHRAASETRVFLWSQIAQVIVIHSNPANSLILRCDLVRDQGGPRFESTRPDQNSA